MHPEYRTDQLLPLSGLQHFVFCRRQWALIHVERQWQENALTAEGRILHRRADDPFFTEKRKDRLIARSVPVASYSLGLSGICDVIEFTASPDGIQLPRREGHWLPAPVEYKRGRPKPEPSDAAQLCAQALCLEEMLLVKIPRVISITARPAAASRSSLRTTCGLWLSKCPLRCTSISGAVTRHRSKLLKPAAPALWPISACPGSRPKPSRLPAISSSSLKVWNHEKTR